MLLTPVAAKRLTQWGLAAWHAADSLWLLASG